MLGRSGSGNSRTYILTALAALMLLALLFVVGLSAQGAFAGRLTDTTSGLPKASPGSSSGLSGAPAAAARSGGAPTIPDAKSAPSVPHGDGFMTIDGSVDTFGNYCAVDCPGSTGCPLGPPCNP